MNILIVEDHQLIATSIRDGLLSAGFAVEISTTGSAASIQLSSRSWDLVILDIMLPQIGGLALLEQLRHSGSMVPVLILSARDTVDDRVAGLEAGADDYLIKPFAFTELLARVRALLRRQEPALLGVYRLADLVWEVTTQKIKRGGVDLDLTATEFQLLGYFLKNAGLTVTRDMLARDVWQVTNRATPLDNVVDVHIARLRKKLDDAHSVKLLHTVRGIGFVLQVEGLV